MYKFIVSWCIIKMISGTAEPQYDIFDRRVPSESINNRSYYVEDCGRIKMFYDRDEAYSFYNLALKETKDTFYIVDHVDVGILLTNSGELRNVYIDSIAYEDTIYFGMLK